MAVVGILALHLTGPSRQQMLQGPKTILDPVAPLPCSYQPWPADGRVETHHVELLLPGLTDHDKGHGAIRRTGRSQPRIAHPWHLLTRPPRPLAVLLQTPPGADESQLVAILFEHRVIADPGPLPAAACGRTRTGGMPPQRFQHLEAQASEPLDPGALGQRPEQVGGQIFVPTPHA